MQDKAFAPLTTPYSEKMDKTTPWNVYPRPSMKRNSFLCLNGEWDFAITKFEAEPEYNEKILVPFPPESELSGIKRSVPTGSVMHYKKTVNIPASFKRDKLILHFGAVDTVCDIFVNKKHVMHHEGGYIPFSVDVSFILPADEFIIEVAVRDDISKIYPYGKQTHRRGGMWYTPVSGIWQTVWLESVPSNYIEKLKITPTKNDVKIEVIGGEETKRLTLLDSGEVYEFSEKEITLSPAIKKNWTPESPYLYRFTLESGKDKIESYFALREVKVEWYLGTPRITLNGAPYIFTGLLDQGYFPDGLFLPATEEGYRDDILTAKEFGFNMLRKHIKIEPEIFYYLCDTLGMVVFQDMVNNSSYSFLFDTVLPTVGLKKIPDRFLHPSKKSRAEFEKEMYETADHLHNFPSIVYYTIFNEGWGQFCADKMYDKLKEKDPTRIIDATSGWFVRKRSDVDSHHVYFKKIKIKKNSNRPIVISEFGGYSHRVDGHLFGKNNYGYRIFKNAEDLKDAFIGLYCDEVIPTIKKGVCALVYTQLSDVEDETNGLITYDRRVKKFDSEISAEIMKKLSHEITKH